MRHTPDDDEEKVLRLIGYWSGPGAEAWPDPLVFVDPAADSAVQQRVSAYLRSGTTYVAAAGFSSCRFCGRPNGSAELTDGVHFVWPEGLAHYIEEHGVRLPDAVTAIMDEPPSPVDMDLFECDLLETQKIVIDGSWWRSVASRASGPGSI